MARSKNMKRAWLEENVREEQRISGELPYRSNLDEPADDYVSDGVDHREWGGENCMPSLFFGKLAYEAMVNSWGKIEDALGGRAIPQKHWRGFDGLDDMLSDAAYSIEFSIEKHIPLSVREFEGLRLGTMKVVPVEAIEQRAA